VEQALLASRQGLADNWLAAWLEAPVWHFACAPGVVGPDAVLGLVFPSVDRAGRHYPMTIAATLAAFSGVPGGDAADAWLAAAEAAGLEALANDGEPHALAHALALLNPPLAQSIGLAGAVWRTAGGPRVADTRIVLPALPRPEDFARMIGGDGMT
jgi:type VI secretion system protein ImpM